MSHPQNLNSQPALRQTGNRINLIGIIVGVALLLLKSHYTVIIGVVIIFVCALLLIWNTRFVENYKPRGGLLTVLLAIGCAGLGYAGWPETRPSPTETKIDKIEKIVEGLGEKYSSTQTIEWAFAPGANKTLNLDNVATMMLVGGAGIDEVELMLLDSVPVFIDKPEEGKRYKVTKDIAVEFGSNGSDAWVGTERARFRFNRVTSPAQLIQVGDRQFRVVLQSVRDKSVKKKKVILYTFGISEQ